jgi:N-acetylmuramic acid 6-phosphate etherase
MNLIARKEADNFLNNEKQFHLGILPTEQSNPKTKDLDKSFNADPSEGVRTLLSIDRDVLEMARRILSDKVFKKWLTMEQKRYWAAEKLFYQDAELPGD